MQGISRIRLLCLFKFGLPAHDPPVLSEQNERVQVQCISDNGADQFVTRPYSRMLRQRQRLILDEKKNDKVFSGNHEYKN